MSMCRRAPHRPLMQDESGKVMGYSGRGRLCASEALHSSSLAAEFAAFLVHSHGGDGSSKGVLHGWNADGTSSSSPT